MFCGNFFFSGSIIYLLLRYIDLMISAVRFLQCVNFKTVVEDILTYTININKSKFINFFRSWHSY